jgi:hypothetical protein
MNFQRSAMVEEVKSRGHSSLEESMNDGEINHTFTYQLFHQNLANLILEQ